MRCIKIAPKYRIGDLIEIPWHKTKYEDWEGGIFLIKDYGYWYYNEESKDCFIMYIVDQLRGNLRFEGCNSLFYDKMSNLILIGNINDNSTLRLLYAKD